jgi:hypothetical protein
MEFTGKIIVVGQERGGVSKTSNNPWLAKEYVIEETGREFPKKMCFEVFGEDNIRFYDLKVGDLVTVYFDIVAREWKDRWFNSIRAWKVERPGAGHQQSSDEPF